MPAPWKSTYCTSCGHFGRPSYSLIYALLLLIPLGIGAGAGWYLPQLQDWSEQRYAYAVIAVCAVAFLALLYGRRAQSCRRCEAVGL